VILFPADVPVDPDAPEAKRWLLTELAKPEYQQAKPSPIEDAVNHVLDWLNDLIDSLGDARIPGLGSALPIVLVVVVVALLVIAFLVFGLPRLNRKAAVTGELFGEDDLRDADALRRDARRAAAAGDYATAVADMFRAIARRLDERTIVSSFPGSTARDVARRAALAFPDAGDRLTAAAADFDGVRYLGRAGDAVQWHRMEALEADLRDARPLRGGSLDDALTGSVTGGLTP